MKSKTMVTPIIIILAGVGLALLLSLPKQEDSFVKMERIIQEVKSGEAWLLDVRTAEERIENGYAKGSEHFDLARLSAGVLPHIPTNMDRSKVKIYVYCRTGNRSGEAASILSQNGFLVENIGSLRDWEIAGGEVIRP
jgi:phage shock protein E